MPSNRLDKVTVKVLHNEGYFYTAGSRLTQVLEFESDFPACGHVWPLLEHVAPIADDGVILTDAAAH